MSINTSDFKETIEINRADMENNTNLVNELIINDLMIELGYNKRKDKNVRRLYNGGLDWIVMDADIKLAVKVLPLDAQIDSEEINQIYELCASKLLSILIITNGETLYIMRYLKQTHNYTKVLDINLTEELNSTQEMVLHAISKDTYDLSLIDNLLKEMSITVDNLVKVMEDNSDDFKSIFSSLLKLDANNVNSLYEQLLNKLNSTDAIVVNEDIIKDSSNIELEQSLKDANEHINELENQIASLEAQLNEPKEHNTVEESNVDVNKYLEHIEELNNKYSAATVIISELEQKIEEYEKEISELSGSDRKKAIEVLNIIEDTEGMDRSYVGVINTELLNFESLNTFVGRVLQKLYELKNFEASQYIFNADLFKLCQDAKRNDLIMNNKAYDIDLEGMTEDTALNKLRLLFNHFPDVIFECKKIGTLKENVQTVEENEDTLIVEEELSEGFESTDESSWEQASNNESTYGEYDEFEEDNIISTIDNSDNRYLLVQNLVNIDSLVWTEEPVQFNNIKYIGNQEITFAINVGPDQSFDLLLSKCIDAILAVEAYNGNSSIIQELKHKQFNFVNNSIKVYSDEYKNYPRINGTKYVIVDVASVQQVATMLLDICDNLGLSTDDKFLYFDVVTESKLIVDGYGFSEESVQLRESDYFNSSSENKTAFAIIKGDMFNNLIMTQNSLRAHKDIIGMTTDVKTKYFAYESVCDIESVQKLICRIVEYALNNGVQVNYNIIGNVIDSNYKLVSNVESEASPNHFTYTFGDETIYCSELQYWQVPYALIKVHTSLFNNTAIALRTQINVDAVNYYGRTFETTEPSLSLAIKSFVDYIVNCVKNN